jgi:hypothetical protein
MMRKYVIEAACVLKRETPVTVSVRIVENSLSLSLSIYIYIHTYIYFAHSREASFYFYDLFQEDVNFFFPFALCDN